MPLFSKRKNGTLILNRREFKAQIRKILGTNPGNIGIYEMALIHRSASIKLPDGSRVNNERLEFLGDSILNSILSDFLFRKYHNASEGFMTKMRSKIVNREFFNHLAVSIGLDRILVSNIPPSTTTRKMYGNALEAFIGALFIDKGYVKTRKIFIEKILMKHIDLEKLISTDNDYKSLVFEWTQKRKLNLSFINNEDYDFKTKKSVFSSTLLIEKTEYGRGYGASKKEAEQEASCQAWNKINNN
ncbi:MAG TPA: ribonuclease III [Bacteroidales bacterium]|nr:ribonuclease III [Bacteroidales bacterium]HRR92912.1 ribonuclease III [Bacteroidales bacterium]HRT89018.1 ribonuclease III [Bacteroidales bacterium]